MAPISSSIPSLPSPKVIQVDTRGAVIVDEESPDTRDSRGIYLPNHIEPISHIAIDIGGSLAKVVYFTRSPPQAQDGTSPSPPLSGNGTPTSAAKYNGALTPAILEDITQSPKLDSAHIRAQLLRRVSPPSTFSEAEIQNESSSSSSLPVRLTPGAFPGGLLNFTKFETDHVADCLSFISHLISSSAKVNGVTIDEMKVGVQIIATGGGAHKFHDLFEKELGMKVEREDEMDCLITGLGFVAKVPDEVYFFGDELIHAVTHPSSSSSASTCSQPPPPQPQSYSQDPPHPHPSSSSSKKELERPSPNPPLYTVSFEPNLTPQLPCLLVNIGSGVSIIHVAEDGSFERVTGTSLGGGTLWGLLSLLTGAQSFDEMLAMSEKGDNANVDMLVGDIYGQDYTKLGLRSTTIASSFGKVFRKSESGGNTEKREFKKEDIAKSLLYAISNNIGQIAYMNAEKYNVSKIYFGGFFIRGHPSTIATLSYAIRFWSKGTKRALFLRHEGFLGAIGAWIKNIDHSEHEESLGQVPRESGEETEEGQDKNIDAEAKQAGIAAPGNQQHQHQQQESESSSSKSNV